MNPNGPHQIPLNPALMNTLMASLQSQPQMQTFGASGAGADPVFMLANFQQQQQRPGLQGAPNFFLHGFQPQNMAGPSMPGGQQWILPQSQPPTTVPPAPQASFKAGVVPQQAHGEIVAVNAYLQYSPQIHAAAHSTSGHPPSSGALCKNESSLRSLTMTCTA